MRRRRDRVTSRCAAMRWCSHQTKRKTKMNFEDEDWHEHDHPNRRSLPLVRYNARMSSEQTDVLCLRSTSTYSSCTFQQDICGTNQIHHWSMSWSDQTEYRVFNDNGTMMPQMDGRELFVNSSIFCVHWRGERERRDVICGSVVDESNRMRCPSIPICSGIFHFVAKCRSGAEQNLIRNPGVVRPSFNICVEDS